MIIVVVKSAVSSNHNNHLIRSDESLERERAIISTRVCVYCRHKVGASSVKGLKERKKENKGGRLDWLMTDITFNRFDMVYLSFEIRLALGNRIRLVGFLWPASVSGA